MPPPSSITVLGEQARNRTTESLIFLEAVTPSNSEDLDYTTRALYVGVSGDVKVMLEGMTDGVVLKDLAAGVFHPLRVKRVYATGTDAEDIVGGY